MTAATVKPKRIQRRRAKGWRSPEGAIYVGRPNHLSNPWKVLETNEGWVVAWRHKYLYADSDPSAADRCIRCSSRAEAHDRAVALYGAYIRAIPALLKMAMALAGRDLVCWCPPYLACHADLLLEIANGSESPT